MNDDERQAFLAVQQAARTIGGRCLLIGAHARELCLPATPRAARHTTDVDIAILLDGVGREESLMRMLDECERTFDVNRKGLRVRHRRTQVPVDLMVCGDVRAIRHQDERHNSMMLLDLETLQICFDSSGFDAEIPFPSAEIFVFIKLLAWEERKYDTDLIDVGYVLQNLPNSSDPFDDPDFIDELAGVGEDTLAVDDHAVWRVGRHWRTTLPSNGIAHVVAVLRRLRGCSIDVRAQLVEYLPLNPDDRLRRADRLVDVLLRAVG